MLPPNQADQNKLWVLMLLTGFNIDINVVIFRLKLSICSMMPLCSNSRLHIAASVIIKGVAAAISLWQLQTVGLEESKSSMTELGVDVEPQSDQDNQIMYI